MELLKRADPVGGLLPFKLYMMRWGSKVMYEQLVSEWGFLFVSAWNLLCSSSSSLVEGKLCTTPKVQLMMLIMMRSTTDEARKKMKSSSQFIKLTFPLLGLFELYKRRTGTCWSSILFVFTLKSPSSSLGTKNNTPARDLPVNNQRNGDQIKGPRWRRGTRRSVSVYREVLPDAGAAYFNKIHARKSPQGIKLTSGAQQPFSNNKIPPSMVLYSRVFSCDDVEG